MKKIKCFVSIIVSLALIFTAVATSFGASTDLNPKGDTDITMTDTDGNTAEKEFFYGYMLMSASVKEAGSEIEKAAYKVNPKYKSILIDVVKELSGEYSDVEPTDEQIIDYISELTSTDAATGIRAFADKVYSKIFDANLAGLIQYDADATSAGGVFSDVAQGYWLIVGKSDENPNSHNNTLVMLDTAGKTAMTVQVKPIDVPVVEKKVQNNEDDEWGDKADYQVGELVPFRLTAHPQDSENKDKSYEDFTTYKLKFTDTLSSGLRYYGSDKASDTEPTKQLKVYAVKDGTRKLIKDTTAESSDEEKKKGYTVTVDDKSGEGKESTLTIDFADLKSIVDEGGTKITVDPTYSIVVEYYAELLPSAVTTVKETNKVKISYSNDPMHDHTADSEEVTVDVYTYGLVIDKKENGEGDVQKYLEGAEFKLYKVGTDGIKNPDNEIKGGIKIQYYTLDPSKDNTLKGAPEANNTDKKAVRFTFEGLDEGTYILEESTVPEGYNGIPDIKFTITPTTDGVDNINGATASVADGSEGTATFTQGDGSDTNKFYLYTTIINNTGVELPSTGGEGRKALLLFGVIFAVGAGVVLATNKRMKKIYR